MPAKILVADDSATIQTAIQLTFSREDVELIPARNGEEAIRKVKERSPGLMLLDTVMPDASGYEVCETYDSVGPWGRALLCSFLGPARCWPTQCVNR